MIESFENKKIRLILGFVLILFWVPAAFSSEGSSVCRDGNVENVRAMGACVPSQSTPVRLVESDDILPTVPSDRSRESRDGVQ